MELSFIFKEHDFLDSVAKEVLYCMLLPNLLDFSLDISGSGCFLHGIVSVNMQDPGAEATHNETRDTLGTPGIQRMGPLDLREIISSVTISVVVGSAAMPDFKDI